MSRFWYLIGLLVVLFVPQLALAQTGALPSSNVVPFSIFPPPTGDWSVMFLQQIFGHVGDVLRGAEATILGQIFRVLNIGLISVVTIIISYTTARSVLGTASEGRILGELGRGSRGEDLGQRSIWTVIRSVASVGILIPKATGYSLIQVWVMWAIVQGVGFADKAWSTALDYLQKGGVIYTVDVQKAAKQDLVDLNLISPEDGSGATGGAGYVGSADMMRSLIAMETLNREISDLSAAKLQDIKNNPQNYPPKDTEEYRNLVNKYNQPYKFHWYISNDNHTVSIPGASSVEAIPSELKVFLGSCGVFSTAVPDLESSTSSTNGPASYAAAKEAGAQQILMKLDGQARHIVDLTYEQKTKFVPTVTTADPGSAELVSSAADYQTIVYPARLLLAQNYANRIGGFYDRAKKAGWSQAGSFYYDISTVASANDVTDNYFTLGVVGNSYPPAQYENATTSSRVIAYKNLVDTITNFEKKYYKAGFSDKWLKNGLLWANSARVEAKTLAKNMNDEILKKAGKSALPDLGTSGSVFAHGPFASRFDVKGGPDAIGIMLGLHLVSIANDWQRYLVDPGYASYTPISRLVLVGDSVMHHTITLWHDVMMLVYTTGMTNVALSQGLAGIAATIGATGTKWGLLAGMAEAMNVAVGVINVGGMVFNTLMFMSLPLVTAITTPLFVLGATLAIYLPLLPFMLFLFGVISWLIYCVEAMAAGPLVALGIAHPEGHDLLGKAVQSVMLLLSVFLRPVAMIIGLIASIILSYVALRVLNAGFAGIVGSLSSGIQGASLVSADNRMVLYPTKVFKNYAVLMVYLFIAMAVMTQAFSIIVMLPETMMRWLGLPPERPRELGMAETVKGGMLSFAQGFAVGSGGDVKGGGSFAKSTTPKPHMRASEPKQK